MEPSSSFSKQYGHSKSVGSSWALPSDPSNWEMGEVQAARHQQPREASLRNHARCPRLLSWINMSMHHQPTVVSVIGNHLLNDPQDAFLTSSQLAPMPNLCFQFPWFSRSVRERISIPDHWSVASSSDKGCVPLRRKWPSHVREARSLFLTLWVRQVLSWWSMGR